MKINLLSLFSHRHSMGKCQGMTYDVLQFLYDRKNFAVVLWYDAAVVVVGVVVGVGVCGQVGFRTITFVPVGRFF